jgi:hypothetical protein
MKAFVDWVLSRRYRLVLLALIFASLLPVASSALIALETARRGTRQGMLSALIGTIALAALAWFTSADFALSVSFGTVTFFSGAAIGVLMRRTGHLVLAFQTATLITLVGMAAVTLFGPEPRELLAPMLAELAELLRASGATSEQTALVEASGGILLATALFSQIVGPLLLAYWWLSIASAQKRFGREFRQLRLGRILGVTATVIVALGLVLATPLVQNLTALALAAFVLQGLAILHAWAHAKRWHVAFVAPVYVLLVTPLMLLVLLGLGALGLLDNWFDLRAPLRAQV